MRTSFIGEERPTIPSAPRSRRSARRTTSTAFGTTSSTATPSAGGLFFVVEDARSTEAWDPLVDGGGGGEVSDASALVRHSSELFEHLLEHLTW